MDYNLRWSAFARRLQPAGLSELIERFNGLPGLMSMAGGLPPASAFPLTQLQASAALDVNLNLSPDQLCAAQQYGFRPAGHEPLAAWVRATVQRQHKPQVPVEIAMTAGAVHALQSIMSCLVDEGDFVVVDEFTYSHAVDCIFVPRGARMLSIAMDKEGMRVDSLRSALQAHRSVAGAAPVRVMYLIPNGQNPTGATMSVLRKRQVLEVAREFDLVIVEDDAYYWLTYATASDAAAAPAAAMAIEAASMPGVSGLPPSLLSMDTDGRVVRVDTFAKLLGPGYRVGWVTASPQLVSKLALAVLGSSVGAASLSQVMLHSLLESWGDAGFQTFLQGLQAMYGRRAAAAHAAALHHLEGVAEWQAPQAGMFMWMHLTKLADVDDKLVAAMVKHKVIVVPGRMSWSDQAALAAGTPCPYIRLSITSVAEQDMDEAFRRLRAAVDEAAATAAV